MNIYEALKKIDWKKAEYFKYKFPELRYDQSRPLKSEEDFLRLVGRKTMNAFTNWEKTNEYKNLVQLYLNTKVADDFQKVYEVVSSKAIEGDEKAVRLFLILQKEIQQNAKLAAKTFEKVEDEKEEDFDEEYDLDLT